MKNNQTPYVIEKVEVNRTTVKTYPCPGCHVDLGFDPGKYATQCFRCKAVFVYDDRK